MFIDIFKVFMLSLIEALTEFIPVSSTAHMILLEKLIHLSENKIFVSAFMIIIQLGAILAVLTTFFKKIFPFIYTGKERENLLNLWKKIIIALIPLAILGFIFEDVLEKLFFNPLSIAISLIFYGFVLIYLENKKKDISIKSLDEISFKDSFLVGIFQCLAMIPGTSRSAATIIGSMILGFDRVVATEFSFFLAIPTMLGVSFIKILKVITKLNNYELLLILLGLIFTYLLSLIVIKKFLEYIKKNDFKVFAYYRIIIAIIILFFYLLM